MVTKKNQLNEFIDIIKAPFEYEPRNGYKDSTVQGGLSNFALKKMGSIQLTTLLPKEREQLNLLKKAFEEYQLKPSPELYEKISKYLVKEKENISQESTQKLPLELLRKDLLRPIQYMKGIGPKRALLFEKLGIHILLDLLYFFPRDYLDRSKIVPMNLAKAGEYQTFLGSIQDVREFQKNRLSIMNILVYDRTGYMQMTFFNQKYLKKTLEENIGKKVIFSGKVNYSFNRFTVDSPDFEFLEEEKQTIHTGRIVPVYKLTAGIYSKFVRTLLKYQLDIYKESLYEFIPQEILKEQNLPIRSKAVQSLHFPENATQLELGRKRIVFEEFLLGQYRLFCKKREQSAIQGDKIQISDQDLEQFLVSLPFTLTDSQKKALLEILEDLNTGKTMNRLLHGDVGSGKTVIAAALFYACSKNAKQSAFMAPTEILARQSYHVIQKFLTPFGYQVDLLISEMKEKDKKIVLEKLQTGQTNIVVGTHALIQENVRFQSLGLVIVDEQHRFGVMQRLTLQNKGAMPHMLVMSATPIPRTVAMTRYGDLDISVINEMPGGKRLVKTKIINQNDLLEIYAFMSHEINKGAKVYIVCPLVEESEKIDAADSIQKAEEMKKIFPDFNILLLHGRMSSQEKEEIMATFKGSKGNILVSTTVIEVGIDIPEASIILIENAERFGLAQLHQLRGRVGRKSQQSYCFLSVSNLEGKKRLSIMEKTNSGFLIAEEDLSQRGPGELFGEKQSGFITLSLVDLEKDLPLHESARNSISLLISRKEWENQIISEIEFRQQNQRNQEIVTIG